MGMKNEKDRDIREKPRGCTSNMCSKIKSNPDASNKRMNILFITHSRLGDAVLSTCILNRLHQDYPHARFTIAVGPIAAELFETVPNLDRLIIIKKQRYDLHWLLLWLKCCFHRWDMVIDCRGSAVSYLLRTKKRYCRYPDHSKQMHRVERYATLIHSSKITPPHIWLTPSILKKSEALLAEKGTVIAIAPAANWRAKTWRAAYFSELIQKIRAPNGPFPNATIALLAASHERHSIQEVIDIIPTNHLIDLIGTQDLLTTAACIKNATLFIGNDSGLMHLSAAMGTPTIALFGPTEKEKYAPFGSHCIVVSTPQSPKELMSTPHFHHLTSDTLMDSITVHQVLSTVSKNNSPALSHAHPRYYSPLKR